MTLAAAARRHWPEYLMEAAGLGLFMLAASAFATLLEHPASPVHQGSGQGDETAAVIIHMNANGFEPSSVSIKRGDTVSFINDDAEPHWPASGLHPTHMICPGFDALHGLATGETFRYRFEKSETCPLHDHLNPSLKGVITVEQ